MSDTSNSSKLATNREDVRVARDHEYERAVELSRNALGFLQKSNTAPNPKNYELFYTYASGTNKALNAAVRKMLADKKEISRENAEMFYDTFIGTSRLDTKVEEIGNDMNTEIKEVLKTLTSATDSTTSFRQSLDLVNKQLGRITDPQQFELIMRTVVAATQKMAVNTEELEDRLSSSHKQITDLHMDLEMVRTESLTDELTGIPNRKRYDHVLHETVTECTQSGAPLSLLMMDIDHFKRFNDTHGHLAGDGVLRLVAKTMQANVKGRDLVARYGGEEYSVILPNTSLSDAVTVAEQIRTAVKTKELVKKSTGDSLGHVTLSIGAALLRKNETPKELIERADICLYAAKHGGRDQVQSENDTNANSVIHTA